MKIKDIVSKKEDALKKELETSKKNLREIRFKIATREEKNVKKINSLKKDIAKINTILREREIEKEEKDKK